MPMPTGSSGARCDGVTVSTGASWKRFLCGRQEGRPEDVQRKWDSLTRDGHEHSPVNIIAVFSRLLKTLHSLVGLNFPSDKMRIK